MAAIIEKPEVSDYEKERGKPMPGFNHAAVQFNLSLAFAPQAKGRFRILNELTIEFADGRRMTPDLCVVPEAAPDWNHEQSPYRKAPLMVVEIPSGSQGTQEMIDKVDAYFANGVQSAWLVDTWLRVVAVYQPDAPHPQVFQAGEIRDPATGLTARVEEIFA